VARPAPNPRQKQALLCRLEQYTSGIHASQTLAAAGGLNLRPILIRYELIRGGSHDPPSRPGRLRRFYLPSVVAGLQERLVATVQSKSGAARALIEEVDALEADIAHGRTPPPQGPMFLPPPLQGRVQRITVLASALGLVEVTKTVTHITPMKVETLHIPGYATPPRLLTPARVESVEEVGSPITFYETILSWREKARFVLAEEASGTPPAAHHAGDGQNRGKTPMTPERKALCEQHASEYRIFLEKYIAMHHSKAGARKAFATSKGLKRAQSNAMIRSGTPQRPRKRGKKRRG